MKDEYIIINKTALLNRLEELENLETELALLGMKNSTTRGKVDEIRYILSQSIPLIPELLKKNE